MNDKINRLVDMYVVMQQRKRKNPWFHRTYNALSEDEKIITNDEIEKRGYQYTVKNKKTSVASTRPLGAKERVHWESEEWDKLADLVASMRRKDPTLTLSVLIKKAMAQFPAERKREINTIKAMQPLIERLILKEKEIQRQIDSYRTYKHKIEAQKDHPTKEQILAALSDEEILYYFKNRVLDLVPQVEKIEGIDPQILIEAIPVPNLCGTAVSKLIENLMAKPSDILSDVIQEIRQLQVTQPAIPAPTPTPRGPHVVRGPDVWTKKVKVSVFGLKPEQANIVEKSIGGLCELNIVDKNQSTDFPKGQDIYLVWSKFCSHSVEGVVQTRATKEKSKFIKHFGGLTNLIDSLKSSIKQLVEK